MGKVAFEKPSPGLLMPPPTHCAASLKALSLLSVCDTYYNREELVKAPGYELLHRSEALHLKAFHTDWTVRFLAAAAGATSYNHAYARAVVSAGDAFNTKRFISMSDEGVDDLLSLACLLPTTPLAIVEILLAGGARTGIDQGPYGMSPLRLACHYARYDILGLLAKSGMNLNPTDRYGRTPLHYACINGDIISAEILLQAGAAPSPRDLLPPRDTPLDMAVRGGHIDIAEVLKKYGG